MGVGAAIVGGAVVSGYMGAKGAKDAAETSAGASDRAAAMQAEQYWQSRQDLSPYREVAVGQEIYGGKDQYEADLAEWESSQGNVSPTITRLKDMFHAGEITYEQYMDGWKTQGAQSTTAPKKSDYDFDEITGYTGGALNELADYGRSQVAPGDYIPDSDIPTYQGSQIGEMPGIDQRVSEFSGQSNIPQFNVQGDIPEFDSTQFDIYKDPSYEWRKEEMLRGLDRTAGATGKITSGNRMEDIMQRTGDMASQEYGSARDRMVQDYGLRRENEATQYGRDVYGYGEDRSREGDLYGRATGEYGLTRSAEDARYGRGVDEYGRVYGRDVDQYGRDLTGYNALVQQEAGQYGRGVDAYGRAYGQEGDYLNRLANLSSIGQTATNTGVQAGSQAAYYGGQAVQAAGQATAAGQIGQATAIQQGIGDMTSMYIQSQAPSYGGYSSGAAAYNPSTAAYNQPNYLTLGG